MMSLKNMLGKLAKKAIEEAPNLIAKAAANAAAEASKRQAELDRRSPSVERSYGNTSSEPKIGGFTVDQWDKRWVRLGKLENLTIENLKPYNKSIGLYKATENGTVKYIGRAIEYNNGGFRKRLRDYVRPSDSGRKHQSGQSMNANAENLVISILIVGNSAAQVETVKQLEKAMIERYGRVSDIWNVQRN